MFYRTMFQVGITMNNVIYTSKVSTFLTKQISFPSKVTNSKMEPQQKSKRPTCSNCSKPIALCLCSRFKTPKLDNKVHVTILQHSLETKHPLNSARVAKLGLKNVDLLTVTDVMFEAQFDIQPLRLVDDVCLLGEECTPSVRENVPESLGCECNLRFRKSRKRGYDHGSELDSGTGSVDFSGSVLNMNGIVDFECNGGAVGENGDHLLDQCDAEVTSVCDKLQSENAKNTDQEALLSVEIGKYGKISSVFHQWKLQNEGEPPDFEHVIAMPEARESLAEGFLVTKLQKQKKTGSLGLEYFEEFQITVPRGSVLLFPTQKALRAETIDFEVKNLIVLDGTWAKANRMFNENPWLKILPTVRLNVEKTSMFNEVRHQPKSGYLSTVESIVYALKELGRSEESEGLDNLLDVFESMVEDQRRCKEERVKNVS